MASHSVSVTHTPVEVEPTEPDANGIRWKQYEPGTLTANCSCGLTLDGPHSAVTSLARIHLGD